MFAVAQNLSRSLKLLYRSGQMLVFIFETPCDGELCTKVVAKCEELMQNMTDVSRI